MQTDLMKSTKVFNEFEKQFSHFFDECERGFTNEVIINMFCRLYTQDKTVIPYKSNVKEMYFIKTGEVLITFDPDNDLYSSTRVMKQGQREKKKTKSFPE